MKMNKRLNPYIPFFITAAIFSIIACQGAPMEPATRQGRISPSILHSPIYLDGNSAIDAFCAGNGTTGSVSNPHVLQNFEITTGGTAISLYNINKYVIIRNCNLTNPGTGIYLENCRNINVSHCFISGSGAYGIMYSQSLNSTIHGNVIDKKLNTGIYLNIASHFILITNNNITRCGDKGIMVLSSNNCMIQENIVASNGGSGDLTGIFVRTSTNTSIESNDIYNNNAYGIRLDQSNNNTITNNLLQNNTLFGISLLNSNYNTFVGNDMISNDNWDENTNYWDNGTRGNFWWDYYATRTAAGHDGAVWNESITVNGGGQDHHALVYPKHPFSYNLPLLIDGNTRMYFFPFKTGNGTLGSPYIIKNLEITVKTPTGNCMYLRLIDKYVIIRNCTLSGAIGDCGIELDACTNVQITNCTMFHNYCGIYIQQSDYNTVSENIVYDSLYYGIWSNGIYNQIINNTCYDITEACVLLYARNNLVENNILRDGGVGVRVDATATSTTVRHNLIENMNHSSGRGVWLLTSGNSVYFNDIIGSVIYNGYDSVGGNTWTNGTHGNYWSDYEGRYPAATELAGYYWSIPYELTPGGVFDQYPLTSRVNAPSNPFWFAIYSKLRTDVGESIWSISQMVFTCGHTNSTGAGSFDLLLVAWNASTGQMLWSRTWGGTGIDAGESVWGDATHVYTYGYTASYGAGGFDHVLIKWDFAGNQIWNRTWGGPDDDIGYSIVGNDTSLITCGDAISFTGPLVDVHAILIKWDKSGNLIWNKTWGNTRSAYARSLWMDDNAIYMSGLTNVYAAAYDMFVVKWSLLGVPTWDRRWGYDDTDYGFSISGDGSYIYSCGLRYTLTECMAVLVKWDEIGNQIWNRTFGSSDAFYEVLCIGGQILTCGYTNSLGDPVGDILLVAWNGNGTVSWNRTWGNALADRGLSLHGNSASVFITGYTTTSRQKDLILLRSDTPDSISPILTISFPVNGTIHNAPFSFQANVYDANFANVTYQVDSLVKHLFTRNSSTFIDATDWSSLSQGMHQITIRASDKCGNTIVGCITFIKDSIAPGITIQFPSNGTAINTTFSFHADVFDVNYAGLTYQVDALSVRVLSRNVTTLLNASDWSSLGQGSHQVTIIAMDLAGNVAIKYIVFVKDTLAPSTALSYNPPSDPDYIVPTTTFNLTSGDAGGSGVASTYYRLNNTSWVLYSAPFSPSTFGNGTLLIQYYSIDHAGNHEPIISLIVYIDTIAPNTTISVSSHPPNFVNGTTTFTLVPSDNQGGSGTWLTEYRINGGSWTAGTSFTIPANGTCTVDYRSMDNVYNLEAHGTRVYRVDAIAPNTTFSVSTFAPNFINGTRAFTLSRADNPGGSGILRTEYRIDGGSWISGTSFTIPANGTHVIDYRSIDNVNNVENSGTRVVRVDAIAPNTTLSFPSYASNFVNATTIFTLGGADNAGGSGLLRREYRIDGGSWIPGNTFTIATNGTHVIDFRGIDNVYNVEAFGTRVVRVDTIAPSSLVTFTPAQGISYVNRTTSFTLIPSDNAGGSGIASRFYKIGAGAWTTYSGPFTLGAYPNGTYTIYHYCVDNIGNVESQKSLTVYLDLEGPAIAITSPGNQTYRNSTVGITITSTSPDFAAAWYRIAHAGNGTVVISNKTYLPGAQETLADGTYRMRAWGNDSRGNLQQAAQDILFTINTTITYIVALLNPANTTYVNQFSLPLGHYTNATAVTVTYLLDNTWSIPGTSTTLDLYAFANDSTFFDRSHVVQVIVVDAANNTHRSAPTWFTVQAVTVPGAEVTIQLEGDPKSGDMYLVKMRVENTGTRPLRRLVIFASMQAGAGYLAGSVVFATGNSTIGPGGTRVFTFQIHVENPADQVFLTLRVMAEGYNATTTALVVVPGDGFDITIVIVLIAAGGAVAAVSVLGYKKKLPIKFGAGKGKGKGKAKRVAEPGAGQADAASRKRDRLMQVAAPAQPGPTPPSTAPARFPSKGLDKQLAAIPAAGTEGDMKTDVPHKELAKAKLVKTPAVPEAPVPAKELARYEHEVKVDAALDKCLVCKRDLVGDVYICPACKAAKYHGKCVRALIANDEPCWACKHRLTPGEEPEDIQ